MNLRETRYEEMTQIYPYSGRGVNFDKEVIILP
jgi:hypothetical protein